MLLGAHAFRGKTRQFWNTRSSEARDVFGGVTTRNSGKKKGSAERRKALEIREIPVQCASTETADAAEKEIDTCGRAAPDG